MRSSVIPFRFAKPFGHSCFALLLALTQCAVLMSWFPICISDGRYSGTTLSCPCSPPRIINLQSLRAQCSELGEDVLFVVTLWPLGILITRCSHVMGTALLYENEQHVADKENWKDSVIRISKIIGEVIERTKGSRQRRQRSKIRRKNQLT